MPENMLNTPATKKQNDAYMRDPTDPQGKPYSREQKAANAITGAKRMMYHKTEESRLFDAEEAPEGWQDTPFTNHNNAGADIGEVPDDEVNMLRDAMDKAGIKYDKRWGREKLLKALEGG